MNRQQERRKKTLKLSDALREEVSILPNHERVRVKALVEHIITLCEHHGGTGQISLGVIAALVAEEEKNNKLD